MVREVLLDIFHKACFLPLVYILSIVYLQLKKENITSTSWFFSFTWSTKTQNKRPTWLRKSSEIPPRMGVVLKPTQKIAKTKTKTWQYARLEPLRTTALGFHKLQKRSGEQGIRTRLFRNRAPYRWPKGRTTLWCLRTSDHGMVSSINFPPIPKNSQLPQNSFINRTKVPISW